MMKSTTGKFLSLILMLFLTPFLLGFTTPDVKTTVAPNGAGKRVIEMKIDSSLLPLLQKERPWFEREIKKRVPRGAKLKRLPKKEGLSYQLTFPFKNVRSFEKREHFFFAHYYFQEKVSLKYAHFLPPDTPAELRPILDSLELQYQLNLPGKIIKASTPVVGGGEARWRLKFGQAFEIQAQSEVIRWHLIIFTGILALILMGIVGTEIIKHQSSREFVSR